MIRISKLRRPNGYWYVRYSIGGRRTDESTRTKAESAAETYRIRREIEINAGIEPLKHAEMTDLIDRYLAAMPPRTTAKHKHEVARILGAFVRLCGRKRHDGTYRLQTQKISPELIDQYVHRRATGNLHSGQKRDSQGRRIVRQRPVSNVTIKTELRYLSGFFNWCCRQRPRCLQENPIPLSNAKRLKNDSRPHYMITEDEYRALLKACDTLQAYVFVLVAWWTGARRSEILALRYYDFDFDACTLSLRHFKNNTWGVLPLSQTIIELVERLYHDAEEADPVFPEDPLRNHGFEKLCHTAGIRHHRFHDFRISTSTLIKAGGFDASLAGLWVGNSGATNRANYTDLTGVATRIGSLLQVSDLPPWPSQSA